MTFRILFIAASLLTLSACIVRPIDGDRGDNRNYNERGHDDHDNDRHDDRGDHDRR